MSPTMDISCRVDYCPVGATHFCEYIGRAEHVSSTGCTIRTTEQPEPGTTLELRLYLPGSAWPIRVSRATVAWAHWNEFSVDLETCLFRTGISCNVASARPRLWQPSLTVVALITACPSRRCSDEETI
jgi:hypothetical protein